MSSSAQATRTLPAIDSTLGAGTFNSVYMRPNLGADATLPANGPYCTCPDIWPSGNSPINDYQDVLAGSDPTYGYAQSSQTSVTEFVDNYIYVRGKNAAASSLTENVSLYYAPSGVIQWPANWVNNVIKTDQGNPTATINALAPAQVGVADRPFVWSNVQPPPAGSDHYCLIAQFNDAENSNPFPDVTSPLDLSSLIQNNLGWGWRNVSLLPSPAPVWEFAQPLDISLSVTQEYQYTIYVQPYGYTGWSVGFSCSQTDSKGQPITLATTPINQDGVTLGVNAWLDPGFTSLLTVYMYNPNNVQPASGAHVVIGASYTATTESAITEAVAANAVDWGLTYAMQYPGLEANITPTAQVPVGTYNYASTL